MDTNLLESINSKICPKCNTNKPLTDFYRTRTGKKNSASDKNGYNHKCKKCCVKSSVKYHQKYPEKHNALQKKARLANPTTKLWQDARRRAKKYNIPFTITKEDIIIPEICPILQIYLMPNSGSSADHSPSLDRIIPSLGYTPENIAVISFRANQIKNNGNAEEHLKIANWLNSKV